MVDNSAWRSEVPEGWWPIYDALLADLLKLDPAVEIVQAKEKFGELRVYLAEFTKGSRRIRGRKVGHLIGVGFLKGRAPCGLLNILTAGRICCQPIKFMHRP